MRGEAGETGMKLHDFDSFEMPMEVESHAPVARPRPGDREIEAAVRTLIAAAGDDPMREGVLDTPARVARAWGEWFAGYAIDPLQLLSRTFGEAEGYD